MTMWIFDGFISKGSSWKPALQESPDNSSDSSLNVQAWKSVCPHSVSLLLTVPSLNFVNSAIPSVSVPCVPPAGVAFPSRVQFYVFNAFFLVLNFCYLQCTLHPAAKAILLLFCSCYKLPKSSETVSTWVFHNAQLLLLRSFNSQAPLISLSSSLTMTQLSLTPQQSKTWWVLGRVLQQGGATSRRGLRTFVATHFWDFSLQEKAPESQPDGA